MGWTDLRRPDGLEIDQFDHDEAVHQIVIRGNELAGYQRMLPTTRPHLLTEVLADLSEGTPPSGPNIWELTRYAVAPGFRDGRRGVSTVGTELIAGFVEWGLKRGVNKVIIEFEPMWVLRALATAFPGDAAGLSAHLWQPAGRRDAAHLQRAHAGRGAFAPQSSRARAGQGISRHARHAAGVVRSEAAMSLSPATRIAQPHADRHRVVE